MEENKPIQNELYEQCDNVANGKLTAIRKQQCVPFGTQMLVYLNVSNQQTVKKMHSTQQEHYLQCKGGPTVQ